MFRKVESFDYENVIQLISNKRAEVLADLKAYPKRIKFGLLSTDIIDSTIASTVDNYNYQKVQLDCATYFDTITETLTIDYFQELVNNGRGFVMEEDDYIVGFAYLEHAVEYKVNEIKMLVLDTEYKLYWESFIQQIEAYSIRQDAMNGVSIWLPAVSVLWQEPYLETLRLLDFNIISTTYTNDMYGFYAIQYLSKNDIK